MRQLMKLKGWIARRQEIAHRYDEAFAGLPGISPLAVRDSVDHAYHLYVIRVDADRSDIFQALRSAGLGVNVHYIPVHLHPFYRDRLGTRPGMCPVAEAAYERIISLPMFPKMSDRDVADVIAIVTSVIQSNRV
jgi:perosamine synthetase